MSMRIIVNIFKFDTNTKTLKICEYRLKISSSQKKRSYIIETLKLKREQVMLQKENHLEPFTILFGANAGWAIVLSQRLQ